MPATTAVLTRSAATAQGAFSGALAGAVMVHLRPKLAVDAKIDVVPMLKGITAKNVKTKSPGLIRALDAALKGKLAKDAEMDPDEVKEIVEQVAEVMTQNSEAIAAELSPEVEATTDDDDAQLREMLKAKGYSDEECDAICNKAKMPDGTASAATDADKANEIKQASDAAIRSATKDMVTKADAKKMAEDAATAAIGAAVEIERQRGRDLRDAEAIVAPVVGKLAHAMDSAPDVFRGALKVLGVPNADTLPEAALRPVFDAHAALKAAPITRAAAVLAADTASDGKSFVERFPDSKRFLG